MGLFLAWNEAEIRDGNQKQVGSVIFCICFGTHASVSSEDLQAQNNYTEGMIKTGDNKRKIDSTDTLGRPSKMTTAENPISGKASNDNCVTPSRISGEAIPAPVWGQAMDNLPYTDVLKCLLVNRMLSFEAPKYVTVLTLLKPCEVEPLPLVKNRRRFENVTHVRILCLIVKQSAVVDAPFHQNNILRTDIINKVVPFLEVFPKIEECLLGGLQQCKENRYVLNYDAEDCAGPEDHGSYFRRLIEQLAVAFERGSLPQDLILEGVFEGFDTEICGCRKDGDGKCSFCSRILRAFPLNTLLQLHHIWGTSCYSNEHIEKLIRERIWSPRCLVHSRVRFYSEAVVELVGVEVAENNRRMLQMRQAKNPSHLYYLPRFKANRLSLMVDLGIRITKRMRKGKLLKSLLDGFGNRHEEGGYALALSTFILFLRAGYPFEATDFVVIDDMSDDHCGLASCLKTLIMDHEQQYEESDEEGDG